MYVPCLFLVTCTKLDSTIFFKFIFQQNLKLNMHLNHSLRGTILYILKKCSYNIWSFLLAGSTYRSDCPLEPRIPIYLLVGGSFGLIKVFLMLWNQKKHSNDACVDDDDDGETDDAVVRRTTKFTEFILSVFLSVWFIIGNVWFYKIWIPNFEQPLHEPNNWCHMTVFRYTFYHLVTCYGLIALVVITTSSFITYYCCKKYHYIKWVPILIFSLFFVSPK